MRTIFYIVRHGQTLFNVKGIIQGFSDSPLTQEGLEQAQKMAERLKAEDFCFGASSTSERARDTLLTIVQDRFPVAFYKDLKGIGFGNLEGDSITKLLDTKRTDWTEFGGETFSQAASRMEKRLVALSEKAPNQKVLVVSHGSVIREVLHDLDASYYDVMPNCSMCKIACEDGKLSLLSLPEVLI